MKKALTLLVTLALSCNSSQKTVKEATSETVSDVASEITFAESITENELKEHLYTYASDEFEGRETGEPGQKMAIAYIKAEYEKLKIPAAKANGDYFQEVPLEISKLPIGKLSLEGNDFPIGEHVLTFSAANTSSNEIVYVGFGIEDSNYTNYNGIDVEGKIVLLKSGEPKNTDGTYKISGTSETSIWSNMSESLTKRIQIAVDKGATGVLYYDTENFNRFKRRFESMKSNNNGRMELVDNSVAEFYSLFIDQILAKEILSSIDTDDTSKILAKSLQLSFKSSNDKITSENVAAFIKGTEKPNEYLVISSHLDHIGISPNGEINNGADDDGSGTVALLEIAEAFKLAADAGKGPKRSILLVRKKDC